MKSYKSHSHVVGSGQRKRGEDFVQIRKKKRHEMLFKKRWEGNQLDTHEHIDPLVCMLSLVFSFSVSNSMILLPYSFVKCQYSSIVRLIQKFNYLK